MNAVSTISQYVHLFWKSLAQGGLGAALAVTTASARVAIPGVPSPSNGIPPADMALLTNLGQVNVFFRLGDSTVVATAECTVIQPGAGIYVPLNKFGNSVNFTHIAAICSTATATLSITTGFANRSSG